MGFEKVAKASDVPDDRGLCVRVANREVAVFRIGDTYYGLDNACPHAGFPLADGVLEGHTVICTAHGWEFDVRTGLGDPNPMSPPLGCYKVRVEDDDLWVEVPGAHGT